MCGGGSPPPAPAPAPIAAPAPPVDAEIIVSGDQKRKRALAGAAGRRNILSGSNDLGAANVGKTLLGA
jgi:hypothetical protein